MGAVTTCFVIHSDGVVEVDVQRGGDMHGGGARQAVGALEDHVGTRRHTCYNTLSNKELYTILYSKSGELSLLFLIQQ
jgi:hypothetical protein